MEKDKFLSDFKEQFIDADTISIDFDTEFRNLGTWDSLTGMSIIVMIEDLYKVQITEVDFKKYHTVNDIYEFVARKRQI
jgi:acyl carrier protein